MVRVEIDGKTAEWLSEFATELDWTLTELIEYGIERLKIEQDAGLASDVEDANGNWKPEGTNGDVRLI